MKLNPAALGLSLGLALATSTSQARVTISPSVLPPRPKLIVMIVIDQFRADYLLRFEQRFLPATVKSGAVGGFRYLMSHGAYFPMAEYNILQSMTCPGHATVLTGAFPYQSGIPINFWNDPKTGQYVYCAEDAAFHTVGAPNIEHTGTSPKNLIAGTVGDELKNGGYPSRVVSMALKDRAAIMMGGHRADLAFWMDSHTRAWVSSNYYLPDGKLPTWMQKLNNGLKADSKKILEWAVDGRGTGQSDEKHHPRTDTAHIGQLFPHQVPVSSRGALALPYGLQITEDAAEKAIDAFQLGNGKATDLFAVSFSSHDYMGHAFGPNSREMEEMTIHEDALVSKLLNHIRLTIPGGLRDVVVVLTGDHGAPPDPDWAKTHRVDAGMINEKELTEVLEKTLTEKFGKPDPEKWINYNHDFDIFVNRKAVSARKAELSAVLDEIKAHLLTLHGVAHAFTLFDYEARKLPPGQHGEQILRTYYPGRSGDVVIIPLPYYMIEDADSVTHLTGYNYDRMVPLAIAGPRIRAGNYANHVRVVDIAPTLSYLAGVLPPELSEGRVLDEALVQGPAARSSRK